MNGYAKTNGHSYDMEDGSVFLFTSESVGEGHPGKSRLFYLYFLSGNPSSYDVEDGWPKHVRSKLTNKNIVFIVSYHRNRFYFANVSSSRVHSASPTMLLPAFNVMHFILHHHFVHRVYIDWLSYYYFDLNNGNTWLRSMWSYGTRLPVDNNNNECYNLFQTKCVTRLVMQS